MPGVSILRSGGEANKVILRGLGDQYTNVTIDGVKIASTDASSRGLDLSTISQSSLAGIELYKALTPDKDADALAGSINLVTKKAPSKRELEFQLKGNYNEIMNSAAQYDFSAKYGERFFHDFLGVQVTGNIENKIRSSERRNLDYDQTINNQTDYEINNFLLTFTDEIRKRQGGSLLFDINTPDNGSVKLNTVYNQTKRDYITHTRDYPSGGGTGGIVTYSFRDRQQEIETFNSSLTGDNYLMDFRVTWGLSFAQSRSQFPFDFYMEFLEPSTNTSGMKNTPRLKENPEKLIPYAQNNFTAATTYEAYYRNQNNYEKDKTAYLNASREYSFGNSITGEVKIGGKYRIKSRNNNNSERYSPYYLGYWKPYQLMDDGSIQPKDLSNTYFSEFFKRYQQNPLNNTLSFSEFLDDEPASRDMYSDLYRLYPLINREKMHQWYDINKNGVDKNGTSFEYYNDPSVRANYYDISESVTSGYLMNILKIGQDITFIAGLRMESENNEYKNKYSKVDFSGFPVPRDDTRDTSSTYSETIYLPNFHLNIKATNFLNIRLAAYKALARPDFNMRLNTYFAWRPSDSGSDKQLIIGNPILKTAQAWNYEINTSFYGNDIGLISISAFYKEITNMYHMLNGLNTNGNVMIESLGLDWKTLHSGIYALTVPYNSPRPTKVWGFEFEHQINFSFLPGLLKNIVLSYNASLVRSETYLISAKIDTIKYFRPPLTVPFYRYEEHPIQVKQQLENQPEFYGNISLGYDIGGFSGRISLFHQSEYNLSFTPSGRGDLIVDPFTRLDLALKQQVTDYLSVMLNISNLTNVKEGNSINNRVNGYKISNINERYGMTVDLGVKLVL